MTLVGVGHALADAFAFVDEDVPKTLGLHPGSFSQVPDYRMRAILATLTQRSLMAGGSAANTIKLAARLGLEELADETGASRAELATKIVAKCTLTKLLCGLVESDVEAE